MPKTLNSPSLNTAKDEVTIIQEITTEIKELIVKDVNAGINKQATTRKIAKLIAKLNKSINNPILLKEAKQSLALSTQRWYYEHSINTKAIRVATTKNINYQIARNINNDLLAKGESYTVNLQSTIDTLSGVKTNNQFKKAYEKFRPYIDDATKGTPIIRDYNKLLRGQIKVLSSNPPISNRVDRNGKPYKVNLRNRAEMFVRYEANMKDLEKFAEDEDVDLVWISSHADASPRCSPFQGKLYSISGKRGVKDGVKYEPLQAALQGLKGDGNGCISGYNCRHRLIEYQKGSRPPTDYSSAEIQKEYKIDQTQRRYENRIRQLKTEERLYRAEGDTERAKRLRLKWRQLNIEYERFSLNNDRAFYRWRTRISDDEAPINVESIVDETLPNEAENVIVETQPIVEKLEKLKDSGMSKENYEDYLNTINNHRNPSITDVYLKFGDEVENVKSLKGDGSYNPATNTIVFSLRGDKETEKGMHKYNTLAHEYAHFFDHKATFSDLNFKEIEKVRKATGLGGRFNKEIENIFKNVASSSDEFLKAIREDKKHIRKLLTPEVKEALLSENASAGVQDAISGFFPRQRIRWGHSERYYNQAYATLDNFDKAFRKSVMKNALKQTYLEMGFDASNQGKVKNIVRDYSAASEIWANIMAAETLGGDELEYVKTYLPNSYKTMLELLKGVT